MRPILIAECCQNHNGNINILKKMIHEAAENGADFVKIQAIRSKDLSFRERFENGKIDENGKILTIKRPYQAEFDRLSKLDLTIEDENWFIEECKKAGVKSMTTVFTRTSVDEVVKSGYDALKFASYYCASIPLLKDLKKTSKKLFISTGSTFDNEIKETAILMKDYEYEFLHCVTIYPTPLEDLHLERINFLRKFNKRVGYSDHSKPADSKLWASKIALAMGASNIERHYTVLEAHETKDGPVSINPKMLKELRMFSDLDNDEQWNIIEKNLPNWKITLGNPLRNLTENELLNRDYYRGRFVNKNNGKEYFNWE